MSQQFDFSSKVVLVTGSSRGIGAAIITAFGKLGARCVVNYVDDPQGRNKADAQKVAGELKDSRIIQCDVGDDPQVSAMMTTIKNDFGGLDILVNNAGLIRDRTIKKMSTEDWDTILRVNLTGAFNCIRHASFILNGNGRIVNVSSVAGVLGFFGQANYASSKAGLLALTKVAARELAKTGATVNAVAPGFIDTEMTKGMPEDVTKKFIEQIPVGRMGTTADIVNGVLFLASAGSSYITGHTLHINGGFYVA